MPALEATKPLHELRPPSSRVTIIYVTALVLIAIFSVTSFLLTDSIIDGQKLAANTVNTSGRQRMLSQRIVWLSMQIAGSAPGVDVTAQRKQLQMDTTQMRNAHQAMFDGGGRTGLTASSPAMKKIFLEPPYMLDQQMRAFLADANTILTATPEQLHAHPEVLERLEAAARQPLLKALDAAVVQYQVESEASIARLRSVQAWLTGVMLVVLLCEALFIYRPLFNSLLKSHAALLEAARTDPLTGCLNRRSFTEEAGRSLATAQEEGRPASILLIDIDHFKRINDTYGHAAGDYVITSLVFSALGELGRSELLGRLGGEEFVIFSQRPEAEAKAAAERLRQKLAALRLQNGGGEIAFTVSIGVAEAQEQDGDILGTILRADNALYAAKQGGRDRVAVAE